MTNQEQIEYWSEKAGPEWVAEQSRLDDTVSEFGDIVLERAAIEAGQSVLDVGCGTGQTTVAAARASDGGHVLGVDVSRVMLEAARRRAADVGVVAEFVEADAQVQAFDPSFDHVISRFGVMFFEDPTAAFANLLRAARSGGKLTFVCWQGMAENPWVALPARALSEVIPLPPREPGAPGPFAFADGQRLRALLTEAGWCDVHVESVKRRSHFGDGSLEGTLDFLLTIGPVASALRDIDDQDLHDAAVRAVTEAIRAEVGDDGRVALGTATWLVEAQKRR